MTYHTGTNPEERSWRIDENLSPLFVLGVDHMLSGLSKNAWEEVSRYDYRAGKHDYLAGQTLIAEAAKEAPKIRQSVLRRDIGSKLLLMTGFDVPGAYTEVTDTLRTFKDDKDKEDYLRYHFGLLRDQPERYIEPHIIIGVGLLAKEHDALRETGHSKKDKLTKIVPIILAAQGLAASRAPIPPTIAPVPFPRSGSTSKRETVVQ